MWRVGRHWRTPSWISMGARAKSSLKTCSGGRVFASISRWHSGAMSHALQQTSHSSAKLMPLLRRATSTIRSDTSGHCLPLKSVCMMRPCSTNSRKRCWRPIAEAEAQASPPNSFSSRVSGQAASSDTSLGPSRRPAARHCCSYPSEPHRRRRPEGAHPLSTGKDRRSAAMADPTLPDHDVS